VQKARSGWEIFGFGGTWTATKNAEDFGLKFVKFVISGIQFT
jgi:hypothetical protein